MDRKIQTMIPMTFSQGIFSENNWMEKFLSSLSLDLPSSLPPHTSFSTPVPIPPPAHKASSSSSSDSAVCVITEDVLLSLYGEKLKASFGEKKENLFIFSFPGKEENKTRQIKESLEDRMLGAKLGKDTLLIAFGGGVVLDMAGFVASTYMRGVSWIGVPTTLLAMVDVAMSGKTGVNTSHGKNLIGSFYLPNHLIFDLDLLDTLPEKEWQNGFFEILKMALLFDESLFLQLIHFPSLQTWPKVELRSLIEKNIHLKEQILAKDFYDRSERKLLNFGHTIGHALEKASGYQIPHGQAVAIGILTESYLSQKKGVLSQDEWEKIQSFLMGFRDLFKGRNIDLKLVKEALFYDKKTKEGMIQYIELKKIGKATFQDIQTLDESLVNVALSFLQTYL